MGALYRGSKIVGSGAFLLVTLLFCGVASVDAGSLAVSPASGSASVGGTINVILSAASDATALNAVSGTLSFPSNLLEVVSLSKSQSMLSLWHSPERKRKGIGMTSCCLLHVTPVQGLESALTISLIPQHGNRVKTESSPSLIPLHG